MNEVLHIDPHLIESLSLAVGGINMTGTSNRHTRHGKVPNNTSAFSGSGNIRRRNQTNEKQDIIHDLQVSTLRKFCAVCEALNLDPLSPHSVLIVTILLSRYRDRILIAQSFIKMLPEAGDIMLDWDVAANISFLQDKFSTLSDWNTLLAYTFVEIADAERERVCSEPHIAGFINSLHIAGLAGVFTPTAELSMMCILHMSPANTPSSKMLERFLTQRNAECRELEVKCLRSVAHFTDQTNDDEASASTFLCIARHVRLRVSFGEDVRYLLMSQKEVDRQQQDVKTITRPRLPDRVQAIHNDNVLEYQQTFESWCCQNKFSNTTGLNVQRLLYFINAQTVPVDIGQYEDYFTSSLTSRMALQSIETIDVDVVITVICGLRMYLKNVQHLIDFRVQCLDGLNISTRKALSLAQILQLYVCCFQHESIRDKCWKSVLLVLNHSIQNACVKFRATYPYEIESIIRTAIACHVSTRVGHTI